MKKNLVRGFLLLIAAAFILEAPSAYAIFGIRAARTVLAARRAKKMTSSPASEDAYAQEKSKFTTTAGSGSETGRTLGTNSNNI